MSDCSPLPFLNIHFPHFLSPHLLISSLSFPRVYYGTTVIFLFPYPPSLQHFSSLFTVFSLNQSHFIQFWYVVQLFGRQRADQNREGLKLIPFTISSYIINLIIKLKSIRIVFANLHLTCTYQRNKSYYLLQICKYNNFIKITGPTSVY